MSDATENFSFVFQAAEIQRSTALKNVSLADLYIDGMSSNDEEVGHKH